MAAIDVHMFLENLKQLKSSGVDFVASQRDELQIVYQYIKKMSKLLKSAEEEGSTDQKENSVAMHIRDLVFEAENVVDQFIVDSVSSGGGCDFDLSTKLDGVKGKMEAIINICKHGKFELEWWYSKPADSTTHVVGLRPQKDKIMCRFKHGISLEIISTVSLPGTGKTTLAKQISNGHCTKEKFEIQIWVKVCEGYRKRDFLAAILDSLNPIFKEKWDTSEEELGAQLLEFLQDHKYLIVMNDMSTAHELFDLQTYLPNQCNGSKIIVTTWEAFVGREIKERDYYEPDVCMFVENLKQLMSSGIDFVTSQRDELQIVYEYINEMGMLLKLTEEEGSTDMAMHIRDVVFVAENIVDLFVVDCFSSGGGGDRDLSTKLDSVKGEMEAIINCCKHGKFELEWWYTKAADNTNHIAGLRLHRDRLMCRLKHGKSLEIISIAGLPGTGTTTLAKQIYNDYCTKETFEIQVWIKVCPGYRKRDFLAAILESLNPIFKGKWVAGEEALGAQLLECLQDHKYLIVMNDMSTPQELFDLQTYLPSRCNGSKIIVTTWEAFVGMEIKEQDYYETDVGIFLQILKQLMSSGLDFVTSRRDELQIVYEYINEMSMLLKSTEEEGSTEKAMHIRDLVLEAESIVVEYSVSSGGGVDCDLSTKLDIVKGEMEAIIKRTKDSKFELEWWYTKAADSSSHVIGMRPQMDKIMRRFKDGKSLDIISIVGLPGTGKTTLAKQIYNDHCTRKEFEIQMWIKVSQECRKRDFLAAILESFNHIFKDEMDTSEEALGGLLLEHLQDHKYLIVMDDMRSAQALFDLQTYLPDQCNGSKIIVTTGESMVTKAIRELDYYNSYTIRLDLLSEKDSWGLFRRNLLGHQTTVVSKEVEDFGKLIVKQCHGLPLAIAAISGVVALQSETPSLWAHTLGIFQELYMANLICRYNQLPPHLKACLHYIGLFPEDYHIPVQNLVWLLIAEGFVTEEAPTTEVVAEGYISDLIDTCLVLALEKRMCGATKTCCISSLMREFCSTQNDPRRLFISCQAVTRVSLEAASMQSLRSLLCLGNYDRCLIDVARIFLGNDFKLLKALDLLPVDLQYSGTVVANLKLLTYLAGPWWISPEPITNLFNLETLILDDFDVAYLPPCILKMDKLRHVRNRNKRGVLCFSRSGILANTDFGANVQTMYQLCGCTSCRLVLAKFQRIRKLCLASEYKSVWLLASKDVFYSGPDNLSLLEDLETLKCSYSWNRADMNRVWGANFQFQLPSSIKRLTLRRTFLEWEMISVLGTLPNLEVLKLLEDACARKYESVEESSSCWDTSGQEFPRLKCLKMRGLDITKWADSDLQFKSLEVLSIVECDQLWMLPSGLAQAPRLYTLEVKSCNGYVEGFFNSIV